MNRVHKRLALVPKVTSAHTSQGQGMYHVVMGSYRINYNGWNIELIRISDGETIMLKGDSMVAFLDEYEDSFYEESVISRYFKGDQK